MSAFVSPLNLAALIPARGIRIAGGASTDRMGWTVAAAGDMNGDGLADSIVSTWNTGAGNGVATAYVLFGRSSGWSDIDLANPLSAGFRIDGASMINASIGAGDLNGDGYGDIILWTALYGTDGRTNNGSAAIVYGHAGSFSTIDLTQPLGSAGVRIAGAAAGDFTGHTAAVLGDFNGDGFADAVVGGQVYASYAGNGFAGAAYILLGSASGILATDLANPGSGVFRIDGATANDVGRIVAPAGDLNGDGLADLVTGGAYADANGRTNSGTAYVVFGRAGGSGTLNLADLGAGGFRIHGAAAGDLAGSAVASAGDFNGDGFTDLLIGAPETDYNGRSASGSVYLVYGRAGGFGDIDLANPSSYALRIDGAAANNYLGQSVASAGDVNGDGFDDLMFGASNSSVGLMAAGSSYIILGRAGGYASIDLNNLGSAGCRIDGAGIGDGQGYSLAGVGDADGDGFSDVLTGAFQADPLGRIDAGAAYILFSQAQGGAIYRGTTLADTLRGSPDNDSLSGFGRDDRLFGMAGDDTLDGGAGNDWMAGGAGNDTYLVDSLSDRIDEAAPDGQDTAWVAATGNYMLGVNVEIARLYGAATQLTGSNSAEQLVANAAFSSTLDGGGGDDVLWGSGLANTLMGGAGDDIVRGIDGGGLFVGGQGNDQYVIGNTAASILENAGGGADTAWVTVDNYTLPPEIEIGRLAGNAIVLSGSVTDEQLVANPTAGSMVDGGGGNDVLWGSAFADVLDGGMGDDILRGQGGADTLRGGVGNDHFVIIDNLVVLFEAAGGGDDTAWVAVNGYSVGANIERINLSGQANTAIGNASDNIIAGNPTMENAYLVGGAGADIIFGGGFADTFRGDAGDDTLYSMGGADCFVYQAPGWGYDAINGFMQGQARLVFTGSGIGFDALTIVTANGNSQVQHGGSAILLFGVASLTEADFLF